MDARRLRDRIAWGRNLAARRIGEPADAFRPRDAGDPLSPANRYLRLHAAFSASPTGFGQIGGHGSAACYGHFDTVYTRPGDYLVQGGMIVFIAAQDGVQPTLCIRTNRRLTIERAASPVGVGGGASSGRGPGMTTVLTGWPASMMGMALSGTLAAGLPSDPALPQWTGLLPPLPGITILPADLVQDDDGMRGAVVAAERSSLGWRMTIRQVAI